MSQSGRAIAVETFRMPARRAFTLHAHPAHQLATSVTGVLSVRVREQVWILPPSRALWIPAGVPHTTSSTQSAVLRSAYIAPGECPIEWLLPTPLAADRLLLALIARLERDDLDAPQRRRAEAVLYDILTPTDTTTISLPVPVDARAAQVAAALAADPTDPRTIDQWGRAVGASGRTLARIFAAETRQSFGQWRTAVRMAAGLELLAAGEPVSRTARMVGFGTTSAFVAAFGRTFGVTPGTYFTRLPHGRAGMSAGVSVR